MTSRGPRIHTLVSVDESTRQGICQNCGPVTAVKKKQPNGAVYWRCSVGKREYRKPWIKHRKSECERCGFIPEHLTQLDVDHINGDNSNNNPSNLQTLCANCHRLKTYENKDSWNKVYRVNPLETL
jgi:hypothetical protein